MPQLADGPQRVIIMPQSADDPQRVIINTPLANYPRRVIILVKAERAVPVIEPAHSHVPTMTDSVHPAYHAPDAILNFMVPTVLPSIKPPKKLPQLSNGPP